MCIRDRGEICTNGTRVFVQRGIADKFLARLKERTLLLRVGDPTDPATEVGALISAAHRDKVLGYVASGVADGATLVCGGTPVSVPGGENGNFVAPTIFAGCTDGMTIVPVSYTHLDAADERSSVDLGGRRIIKKSPDWFGVFYCLGDKLGVPFVVPLVCSLSL